MSDKVRYSRAAALAVARELCGAIGKRWNLDTCALGRPVILSRGYGKAKRLKGRIVGCCYDNLPSRLPGWLECYGPGGCAVCITIELDPAQ